MILLLSSPSEPLVQHLVQKLQERRATYVQFDYAQFPTAAELSLSYEPNGQGRPTLRAGQDPVDLSHVDTVLLWRPNPPAPHEAITDEASRAFVKTESLGFLNDAWSSLDARWLPARPSVVRDAAQKVSQLQIAASLGFEFPPTLVTNSPDDFLAFYRRYNGNVVGKLVGVAFLRHVGDAFGRYTEMVTKRDVGYAHAVRYAPVIFQAYVPKRLELRITVVGQRVFAAAIDSQATNHTRHDWRRYDYFGTSYLAHDLPDEVARRCVRLLARLGLSYGAIDMILTPDGRYVFLEINPSGLFLWIEEATGLPISEAICDWLMATPPSSPTAEPLVAVGGAVI
ncbi:MAG: MvdC/MvdD family ATP grasp protein [Thermomicrobiales bacterium]